MHHVDLDRARREMAGLGVEALIAASVDNVFYCTGNYSAIWGEMRDNRVRLAVIPSKTSPFVVCPESEARSYARSGVFEVIAHPLQAYIKYGAGVTDLSAQARNNVRDVADLGQLDGLKAIQLVQPIRLLAKVLKGRGLGGARIGLDKEFMAVPAFEEMAKELPNCVLVDASQILLSLRAVKSPEEVEYLRKAAARCVKAMQTATAVVRDGATLSEVRRHVLRILSEGDGYEPRSFSPILDLTPSTAGTTASLTDAPLKKGQVLMVDTGGQFNHYRSDLARTWAIGDIPADERRLYDTLLAAQEAMVKRVVPGTRFSELYRVGKDIVSVVDPDYGRRKTMGHSIGIAAREWPDIKPLGEETLQPGMVICVEVPYHMGGGHSLSIEDEFLVTEKGHELLSVGLSRELQVV